MKTISLELCKKLSEAWVLDGVETEYIWCDDTGYDFAIYKNEDKFWKENNQLIWWPIKTLTLEEAIEILPDTISKWANPYNLRIRKATPWLGSYKIDYSLWGHYKEFLIEIDLWYWKTLLEAIEKMLEYLLDNNLLKKYNARNTL